MIQQSQKFSFRHGKCLIGILCDSQILLQITESYSGISGCIICQDSLHLFIIRACICNTQFPVRVGLCDQGIYHLFQKFRRCLIGRYRNTDQRSLFEFMFSLFLQCLLIRDIYFIPGTVWHLLRFEAFMKPYPEFFWSVMFQIAEPLLDRIGRQFL